MLVVQKTGWGKSFVYFIATKLLRDGGSGPALLISPLLALMRNQIAAAERMGVRAATINSDNQSDWDEVEAKLRRNEIDILLISPERLANERFRTEVLADIAARISLLVVDGSLYFRLGSRFPSPLPFAGTNCQNLTVQSAASGYHGNRE